MESKQNRGPDHRHDDQRRYPLLAEEDAEEDGYPQNEHREHHGVRLAISRVHQGDFQFAAGLTIHSPLGSSSAMKPECF